MIAIDVWLGLPTLLLFLCLALGLGSHMLVLYVVVFRTGLGSWLQRCVGVAAPFLGSVAVLFSLMTGFLANDVWDRSRQATRAVLTESDNIRALYNLSIASNSDMALIREDILAYVHAVIRDEWPSMSRHESAPAAERSFALLLQQVSDPHISTESGSAVHSAMLGRVMQVGSSRHDRIVVGQDRSDEFEWAAVILLAFFTQIAIGTAHLERARAFLLTQTIFTTAVVVTLGLVAMREQPFSGSHLVRPLALQRWLGEISAKAP